MPNIELYRENGVFAFGRSKANFSWRGVSRGEMQETSAHSSSAPADSSFNKSHKRKNSRELATLGSKRAARFGGWLLSQLRVDQIFLRSDAHAHSGSVRFAVGSVADGATDETHTMAADSSLSSQPPATSPLPQLSVTGPTGDSTTASAVVQSAGVAGPSTAPPSAATTPVGSAAAADASSPAEDAPPSTPPRVPPINIASPPRSSGKRLEKKSKPFWEIQEERRIAQQQASLETDEHLLSA